MESLFRKVRKTPQTGKHGKLGEGWDENREAVTEGVSFYLKYLGSTLLDELPLGESYGEGVSSRAVQRIVDMARTMGTKLEKVSLKVTPNGIRVVSMEDKETKFDVSIYRISFCTADKNHEKLFAFIARNSINETMECHAFYCAKHKIAQAVTLSVSQAFQLARDLWENKKNQKNAPPPKSCASEAQLNVQTNSPGISPIHTLHTVQSAPQMPTIDLLADTHPRLPKPDSYKTVNSKKSDSPQHRKGWQTFDETPTSTSTSPVMFFTDNAGDNDNDNPDEWFSQLAENRIRSTPPVPSQPFSSFSTDLCKEDLDDSITAYLDGGNKCLEAFSRTRSVEDLLNI